VKSAEPNSWFLFSWFWRPTEHQLILVKTWCIRIYYSWTQLMNLKTADFCWQQQMIFPESADIYECSWLWAQLWCENNWQSEKSWLFKKTFPHKLFTHLIDRLSEKSDHINFSTYDVSECSTSFINNITHMCTCEIEQVWDGHEKSLRKSRVIEALYIRRKSQGCLCELRFMCTVGNFLDSFSWKNMKKFPTVESRV